MSKRQRYSSLRPVRTALTTSLTLDEGREIGPSQQICPELAMRICKSDAVRQNLFIKKTVLKNSSDGSDEGPTCHIELTVASGLAKTWTFCDQDSNCSLQFPIQDLTAAAQIFLVANRAGLNATERLDLCLRAEDGYTQLGCLGLFDLAYNPTPMKEGSIETLTLETVLSVSLEYLLMVDASPVKRKLSEMSAEIP